VSPHQLLQDYFLTLLTWLGVPNQVLVTFIAVLYINDGKVFWYQLHFPTYFQSGSLKVYHAHHTFRHSVQTVDMFVI